ncbi:MBL fold metallo-hydrolase [Lysinibacillus xylanilyticus]|uniref:MBL fold metallo-hydrolase n=1 Tax=Lysinibacillus xylanilyticus TaxID=582475 RepID=UPI002E1FB3EF|nr:MBL fold metallo-hydrolase [Lysinibacillus xylanilyticus]
MNDVFYSKHFKLEKISNSSFAAISKEGGGAVANAGFVDLGDKVIVFDTFNTQQASEDLKLVAEKITNRPVSWVVNSHWHGDHIRGNQTFKDTIIISSEITYSKIRDVHPSRFSKQKNDIQGLKDYIQSLKEQLHQTNDPTIQYQINSLNELKESIPTLELVLPSHTFNNEITLQGTKLSAKLFTLGGGHSYCDAMLYIPDEKVIFMGDLLFVNCHPTFFEESDPVKWSSILKKVERLEIDVSVPGHGPTGTKEDISKIINYISALTSIAEKSNQNEDIEIPEIYKDWSSPEIYQQNIERLRALLTN